MKKIEETDQKVNNKTKKCHHCGEVCPNSKINIGDKYFCCGGCKMVYEILDASDMCAYYDLI